jgi:hypothetical protein
MVTGTFTGLFVAFESVIVIDPDAVAPPNIIG